jgi:hypothetical protein
VRRLAGLGGQLGGGLADEGLERLQVARACTIGISSMNVSVSIVSRG